jgi:hypothetical protein
VSTDDELLDRLRESLAPVALVPPAARVVALRAAAERRAAATAPRPALTAPRVPHRTAGGAAHARRRPASRWRRPAVAAAAAVLVVGIGYAGGRLLRSDRSSPAGVVEYAGPMTAPDGSTAARVTVEKVGIGRVVGFDSDTLPVLPTGELYELWFVGPTDSSGAPDRISAGTFHPDERGRSSVRLVAAVDPALYPRMVVTAEPPGGDPAPNGPEVLEATISSGP